MDQKFIPREKLSKKARRALDAQTRQTWGISPVSRKSKNRKAYDRKSSRRPFDGDGSFFMKKKTGERDILKVMPARRPGRSAAPAGQRSTR